MLQRPHPLIGAAKLWALTSIYWDIYGECYWLLHRRAGRRLVPFDAGLGDRIQAPVEIVPVPGSAVTIEWDEATALPRRFWYSATREGRTEYRPGSVVPFIDVGHGNPLRGVSGAEALRRRLEADFAAETLDVRAAQNGGMPSFWLSTPDQFSEPQLDQIEARLEARQNSPERHNKPALLHGGLKLENVSWTPRDMENAEMREWSRQAIMAVFGVTKPILGITDDVNRANAREAKAVFWEETIIPLQQTFSTTLRDNLLSRLIEGGGRYSCTFDVSGIEALGESLDDKIARVEKLVAMGLTVNKAAELAQWEIDPLTDDDFDQPEPPPVPSATPAPPVAPVEAIGGEADSEAAQPQDRALRAPQTAQARQEYARAFEDWLSSRETSIRRALLPVQQGFLDAVRTKLAQVEQRAWRPKHPEVRAVEDELPAEVLAELERLALPSLTAWVERTAAAAGPELARTYFEAAAAMAAELGVQQVLPETDAVSLAFLAEKEIKLAEGVTSTLADDVRDAIARVLLQDGEFTIAQMSDRILERMEDVEAAVDEKVAQLPVRADRIARTEASAVANRARIAEMGLVGIKQHQWIHSPSPDERGSHAALDGKVVRIGEEFAPGLRWPKDQRAPASEVVNCGCVTAPYDDLIADLLDPMEDL